MKLRIREVMRERGITLQAMADALGTTINAIPLGTPGYHTPSLKNLERCARILRVPIWELLVDCGPLEKSELDDGNLICPHCGAQLSVNLQVKEKHETEK